jgi:hypothetical protein
MLGAALSVLAGACGSSGKHAAPPPSPTTVPRATTTTLPGVQTTGPRTVLSPIGLRVHIQAATSARVVGTAAWNSVLTVLRPVVNVHGSWFEVKGATRTGWITADPRLSAAGEFRSYTSSPHRFSVLYPTTWTYKESTPVSVVFSSSPVGDSIVVTTAATAAKLPAGRPGYVESATHSIVVCGVTGNLVTYTRSQSSTPTSSVAGAATAKPFLLQVRLTLDAHHALGVDGNLTDLGAPRLVYTNFVNSMSFPYPQCIG